MAKDFNTGFWNHFSDEDVSGKGSRYNKVNILFGLFKYEHAKKTMNGQSRGEIREFSALFGGLKYNLTRGNGATRETMQIRMHHKNLHKKDKVMVKDQNDFLKNESVDGLFRNRFYQQWKQNGVVQNMTPPQDVLDRANAKFKKAESPYGDKLNGGYQKPEALRQYIMRHAMDPRPNLAQASVNEVTTGAIVAMTNSNIENFIHIQEQKQTRDAKGRHGLMVVGAFASVGLALASAGALPVALGITIGLAGYDVFRKRSNHKAYQKLIEKRNAVTGAVQIHAEHLRQGTGTPADKAAIGQAVEGLHGLMEEQISRRKTQSTLEKYGLSALSIVGAGSMASGFPGLNIPAVIVGAGGVGASLFRGKKAAAETDAMRAVSHSFAEAGQEIMRSPVVLQPSAAPRNNKVP